ncbi:MAG: prolyl aminopeptidase [Solirubrobacterales bacterium]
MDLFPPIEPFDAGMLAVGDGHRIAWEVVGNPTGTPVLFLHGGPGGGIAAPYRRFFDPGHWRVVLFDQRGCGKSTPTAEISANTTAHLIGDIEGLREHLGIDRWVVFGGSWGSTLALAYGQAFPERCLGFVLRGIFLFRPFEVEWFLTGMRTFFPEAWRRFATHVAPRTDLLAAYHERLTDPDPRVHQPASRAWCAYEEACARLMPRTDPSQMDAAATLAMARIECHYMTHQGFLADNHLLEGMPRLAGHPAIIVQGRYDVVCPPVTADDLMAAWPLARLVIVPDAGHSSMEPGIRSALVSAMENMKRMIGA